MGLQKEQTVLGAFMSALSKDLKDKSTREEELRTVLEQILPVLVPAIIHLLKTLEAHGERNDDAEGNDTMICPLNHIARFMLRCNLRFNESECCVNLQKKQQPSI
ncbi:uncharacterized protein PHALS_04103 [Plasmopara halstedii]|uniref:Uncharacterized protein n=1 Tax=Plasmopara halstedii TaxID=4781 RepID=A0A0P1A974_PLAHL|nr:uncharacterized protein PHALS_04103 [Plasmopara halstedii]CEG36849.1 hypothetical protein PHALS_04103 [Plasmopara halstedii]|eukprot:XP_024573218.1 hypothetical protein PHALS_04103 [Plasmopara halstedii]